MRETSLGEHLLRQSLLHAQNKEIYQVLKICHTIRTNPGHEETREKEHIQTNSS